MDRTDSLWSRTSSLPTYGPLERDASVDVAIVGGGITGLTAALLLSSSGLRVMLIEARRIGCGVTHCSTAHLTEAIDTRYWQIERDFGKDGAKLVAQSSRAAIERVAGLAEELAIPCNFTRRPGYLFTQTKAGLEDLSRELEAARRAGLALDQVDDVPLPLRTEGALRFPNQAQMHVMRYMDGLAKAADARRVELHEESRVVTIDDGEPCTLHLEHGPVVRARRVFVATHAPLNRAFLHTKIHAYRSYVLAFANGDQRIGDGLFWDTVDPYHYFSQFEVDGTSYLVIGGEDHKTGTITRTDERYDSLLSWAKIRFSVGEPTFRWSAQVEEPIDGLPFIGRNSLSENVYVATGYSGNGITFGTVAAEIVAGLVTGRTFPWTNLYTATRIKPVSGAGSFLAENVDFPMHFVSDRLHPAEARSLEDIGPGEGKTVRVHGERLAVYRAADGSLSAVSSVCTHLGCIVKFNAAEKTWDCPCHGSRYQVDGTVIDGPATKPLAKKSLSRR